MKARIYIVDDELMAIQYFKYLLKEAGIDCEIVGEAMNGVKAVPEILQLHPDIVFADISMPVMDGLQMAEEILRENRNQKIIILTSYRDFDYAKRGMNIGVTDYVLKNEFSEVCLRDLITKVMKENLNEKKKQNLIVEHNIRKFLLADTAEMEDHIYEQKPFQRYALISIVKKPEIFLKASGQQEHISADCYEIRNLIYPEEVTCRAVAEMAEGEWCGVFFIDGKVSDTAAKLKEAAKIMAGTFSKYFEDYIILISEPILRFLGLHEVYKENKRLLGYAYAYESRQILRAKEIIRDREKQISVEAYLEETGKRLEEVNQEEALIGMRKFLEAIRSTRNIWEYTEDVRNIYRYLKKYVQEKKIDPQILEFHETGFDPETLEKMLVRLLRGIFGELEQRNRNQYSYYIVSAIEFIQKNYDKDISVPDIAEAVNLSEGYLRKCFKQETNKRIVDYLLEYRLNRAKSMMKDGERRIDQIWQRTGFTSSQYFSFVFKRNEGMTPSDYIKQISSRG